MIEAITKNKMNSGKARLRRKVFWPSAPSFFFFRALTKAKTSVIGMMASVLVSLTVTALSSVNEPSENMLSHVEAAAVTDEVSFIAVPAKMPNASPFVVHIPMARPRSGKKIAARTLKKKITDIDCATSSSSASITGAVAAIAEPPQIDDPTPTRVPTLPGNFITF